MTITIPIEKVIPWMRHHAQRLLMILKAAWIQVRTKPLFLIIALVIGIAMGLWLGPRAGILWFLFSVFLLYEWENRLFGLAAIVCLMACPVLLSLKKDVQAEQIAVYAYFFLVMTVGLQLVEFKRHPERFLEEVEESV